MASRMRFTRPAPRLDVGRVRKNSVVAPVVPPPPVVVVNSANSASESEEEIKRPPASPSPVKSIPPLSPHRASLSPLRARSESVCSTQSLKEVTSSPVVNNPIKLNVAPKKRMAMSETAKKLAESRKEFMQKNADAPLDKAKLKMYDLIYYNPKTNPMTPKPVNRVIRKPSICLSVSENENIEDEEPEPVGPQIKLGPNGEIIIDQESLVLNKPRDIKDIDVIEEDDSPGGFYKRRSKGKDWNKWSTIKFYKALRTYGTDFSLMKSVFPERTRIELKTKYKKELKLNSSLVEKALQDQKFDTDLLEQEFEKINDSEKKELESLKMKKTNDEVQKRKRKRCVTVREGIDQANGSVQNDGDKSDNENSDGSRITIVDKKRKNENSKKVVRKRRRVIDSDLSENEDDSNQNKRKNNDKNNQSEKKNYNESNKNEVENKCSQNDEKNEDGGEKQDNKNEDKISQNEKKSEDSSAKES